MTSKTTSLIDQHSNTKANKDMEQIKMGKHIFILKVYYEPTVCYGDIYVKCIQRCRFIDYPGGREMEYGTLNILLG